MIKVDVVLRCDDDMSVEEAIEDVKKSEFGWRHDYQIESIDAHEDENDGN